MLVTKKMLLVTFYVKSYLKSVEEVVLELNEGRGGSELGTVVVVDDLGDKEKLTLRQDTTPKSKYAKKNLLQIQKLH